MPKMKKHARRRNINNFPHIEKTIHEKAFANNRKDPSYHQLSSLIYKDGVKKEK